MPYIDRTARFKIENCDVDDNESVIDILINVIGNEGEFNYLITSLCIKYLQKYGIKYATYNTIIGVLECVKQEFYRRHVSEYENQKMAENGDVE